METPLFQDVDFYPPIQSRERRKRQQSIEGPQRNQSIKKPLKKVRSNSESKHHSQRRNLVKGTIITIKQMMNPSVTNLQMNFNNQIIKQIWDVFVKNKRYNKQILMALFNNNQDEGLMKKYGFTQILHRYKMTEIKEAMMDFKGTMMTVMTNQNIRRHIMLDRIKLIRKIRLLTFIRHFMMEELSVGIIRHRPNKKDVKRIQGMFKHASQEQFNVENVLRRDKGVYGSLPNKIKQPNDLDGL